MNEKTMKHSPRRNGALIRTQLSQGDLAELSRRAKQEGRSRSNYVTRVLQERINQTNEETQ